MLYYKYSGLWETQNTGAGTWDNLYPEISGMVEAEEKKASKSLTPQQ